MDRIGRYASFAQILDLIAHEGDERRDDQAESGSQQGWYLIANGFTTSGGEDGQRIFSAQDRINDLGLTGTKGIVAPILF